MAETDEKEQFVRHITASQGSMYGYIFSLVGDHTQAADVLQETNLVLWRKASEFRPGAQFLPWAFTIARFQVLAHLRDTKRKTMLLDAELVNLLAEDVAREASRVNETQAALRNCLGTLPSNSRELLDLRYFKAQKLKAIAATLNRTEKAVNVALLRIRRALEECVRKRLAAENP